MTSLKISKWTYTSEFLILVDDVHPGFSDHIEVASIHSDDDATSRDTSGSITLQRQYIYIYI